MIVNVHTPSNLSKVDHLHSVIAKRITLESASSKSCRRHSMGLKSQTVISTTQVQHPKAKLRPPSLTKTWKEENLKRTKMWLKIQLRRPVSKAPRWSMSIEQLLPHWNPIDLRVHRHQRNKLKKNLKARIDLRWIWHLSRIPSSSPYRPVRKSQIRTS